MGSRSSKPKPSLILLPPSSSPPAHLLVNAGLVCQREEDIEHTVNTPDLRVCLEGLNLLRATHLQLATKLNKGLKLQDRLVIRQPHHSLISSLICITLIFTKSGLGANTVTTIWKMHFWVYIYLVNKFIHNVPKPLIGQLDGNWLFCVCSGRACTHNIIQPASLS